MDSKGTNSSETRQFSLGKPGVNVLYNTHPFMASHSVIALVLVKDFQNAKRLSFLYYLLLY